MSTTADMCVDAFEAMYLVIRSIVNITSEYFYDK